MLAVPGIGAAIAGLIAEFRANGDLGAVTAREQRLPYQAWALSRLPRMTPNRLHTLKADLKVETIADLRRAIIDGAAQAVRGVGPQTAAYWLRTIDEQRDGVPIYLAVALAQQLVSHIEEHVPGARARVAGAIARLDEWIEEIELAVSGGKEVSEFLMSSAAVAALPVPGKVTRDSPQVPAGLVLPEELRGDLHVHSDWSPDGRQLAFVSTRSGNGDIYVLDVATNALRRLTYDDGAEQLDAWSPDGQWLYFSSSSQDIAGMQDVFRVRATGGTPMRVAGDRYASEYWAAPSPDGRRLAITARGVTAGQWWRHGSSHIDEAEIWTVTLEPRPRYDRVSSGERPGKGRDVWPMWTPDGAVVVQVGNLKAQASVDVSRKAPRTMAALD